MLINKPKNIGKIVNTINSLYKSNIKNYNKLLTEKIKKTYKKTYAAIPKKIILTKETGGRYKVVDRKDCFQKSNAFTILKSDTDDFESN